MQEATTTSPRWTPLLIIALALLLLGHAAFNAWWLARDHHPIHGNEAEHYSHSILTCLAITSPSAGSFTNRLWLLGQVEGLQPPLLSAAGAAGAIFFGLSFNAIAAANTVFFLILILGAALLAAAVLRQPAHACIAACAAGFTPLLAGASRLMLPELPAAACLVWLLYALLRSDALRSAPWAIFAGICAGLGLLADLSFALWLPGPIAAAFLFALMPSPPRSQPGTAAEDAPRPRRLAHLAILILVAFSCAGAWYYHNTTDLLTGEDTPLRDLPAMYLALGGYAPPEGFPIQPALPAPNLPRAIQAEAALIAPEAPLPQRGATAKPSRAAFPVYARFGIATGLLITGTLAAAGAIALLALKRWRHRPAFLLVATTALGTILLGLLNPPRPEHLLPLLPLLALLATAAIASVPWTWPRRAAFALFLGFFALQFFNLSVAPVAGDSPLAPAALLRHSSYAMGPPWQRENLYDAGFTAIEAAAADRGFVTAQPINAAGFRTLARAYWPAPQRGSTVVVPLDPEFISEPEQLDGLQRHADFYLLALAEGSGAELSPRWLDALQRMRAEVLQTLTIPAYGDLPESRLVIFRLPS